MPKPKDASIETLRGLAILLVVAGYIIQDDLAQASYRTAFTAALEFIYYCFTPIRMPLFTVISAYLYAASPATRGTWGRLVSGKARRILIPFAVVSMVQYAAFSVFPVDGPQPLSGIFRVFVWPYEQLWFLYSIFWIFLIVGAMDAARLLETPRRWAGWLAIALAVHVTVHTTRLFSITGVNYLFPFFLMGYGIRRFRAELFSPAMIRGYAAAALLGYGLHVARFVFPAFMNGAPVEAHKLVGLAITFSAVPLLFHFRRSVPFLARIGSYAFGIHLFNKIALIPVKTALTAAGIENDALVFVLYLSGGVALAVAAQRALERFDFTRRYVLGMHAREKAGEGGRTRFLPLLLPRPAFHGAALVAAFVISATLVTGASPRAADLWNRVVLRDACGAMRAGTACEGACSPCPPACHSLIPLPRT